MAVTRELQCRAQNIIAMRTKDGVATLSDLVRSSLRLRPDLGECHLALALCLFARLLLRSALRCLGGLDPSLELGVGVGMAFAAVGLVAVGVGAWVYARGARPALASVSLSGAALRWTF